MLWKSLLDITRTRSLQVLLATILVITQFWAILQNSLFFPFKIKIKIKAGNIEKAWRKQVGEYSFNFRGNAKPNCTPIMPKNTATMHIQG